jgi:hypothetical protein
VRRACLEYLQRWLVFFYPKRVDLAKELEELAGCLDGQLTVPRLSWKYEWVRKALGWEAARHAQTWLPRLRWSLFRSWDNLLFRMGR